MEMGVLSKWTLFEEAEKVLERKLRANPYHPFQEVRVGQGNEDENSDQIFIHSKRLLRFYLFLLLALASLLFIMIWSSVGGETEYVIFGIASLAVSGYLSVEYYSVHTLVLDPALDQYSVYRGKILVVTQHCHNIYLRLMSKTAGGNKNSRYYLILDGWGLPVTIELCRETTNRKRLRQLGHKLANNLGINYFDIHDLSKHHVICHKPPRLAGTELARHEE